MCATISSSLLCFFYICFSCMSAIHECSGELQIDLVFLDKCSSSLCDKTQLPWCMHTILRHIFSPLLLIITVYMCITVKRSPICLDDLQMGLVRVHGQAVTKKEIIILLDSAFSHWFSYISPQFGLHPAVFSFCGLRNLPIYFSHSSPSTPSYVITCSISYHKEKLSKWWVIQQAVHCKVNPLV